MSGDVFLSHARRLQPDAIRMLFTGYADIQAVINAVNEGHIFRYILKPWDAAELEGVIRQAAEQYELLAERKRLIAELQAANAQLTRGQRGARRGRPAQERVHRGRQPRVQHADHAGPRPERAAPAPQPRTAASRSGRSSSGSPTSARQLAKLVTNTLTLMRADDFRRTLQRAPVDLAALLRGVVDQVLPFVQARHLHLIVERGRRPRHLRDRRRQDRRQRSSTC